MSRKWAAWFVIGGLVLVIAGLVVSVGRADTTIVVTTVGDVIDGDDGLCSLREAVLAANTDAASGVSPGECPAGSGADTIEFAPSLPAPAVFNLTVIGPGEDNALSGDLDLSGDLTIVGAGLSATIVDGGSADRVFQILAGANVTLSGVAVRNGNPGSGVSGGGIAVDGTARLTLNDSAVMNNTGLTGGGVYVQGLLTLNNSAVENNQGGGVLNDAGLLLFTNVDIINNSGDFGLSNQNGGVLEMVGGRISGNLGGGLYNWNADATLGNLVIADNAQGGGVQNLATGLATASLTLSNSEVLTNTATSGAGILNEGLAAVVQISNARVGANIASSGGGGINNNGVMILTASLIDHNQGRSGGGIDHSGSSLQLTNTTLSGNIATDNGGGLHNRGSATVNNTTFSGNQADTGANIYNDGDTAGLIIRNTLLADPLVGVNCVNNQGSISSNGHNLESANTCGFTATGDLIDTSPLLGPLQDNGGPTSTHALMPGSPAVDAGNPAVPGSGGDACAAVDQRGAPRPVDGDGDLSPVCDIGAYEYQSQAPIPTDTPVPADTPTPSPSLSPSPPTPAPTPTPTPTPTPHTLFMPTILGDQTQSTSPQKWMTPGRGCWDDLLSRLRALHWTILGSSGVDRSPFPPSVSNP
jgi:CSLREA domain-containing protein